MLPENYPSESIEEVILRDGTLVTIRPIRPDDAPRLQAGFKRLSAESIYLRFLETTKELSDEQAQRFATVDYQTSMAMVGIIREDGEERLVFSARYVCVGESDPGAAETAIVVRDDFQNRGLGTLAMEHLGRYAVQHGVTTFIATVHISNARIMHFIRRSGFPYDRKMIEPGTWQVRLHVSPAP
jgi:GNAT superfamily N-acetyltransferase